MTERLGGGVAARLAHYLQVLTQAKKAGRGAITSHEISEYTHVNATQIRRERPHRPRVRLGGGGEKAIAAGATRLRLQPDMRQLVGDEVRRER